MIEFFRIDASKGHHQVVERLRSKIVAGALALADSATMRAVVWMSATDTDRETFRLYRKKFGRGMTTEERYYVVLYNQGAALGASASSVSATSKESPR